MAEQYTYDIDEQWQGYYDEIDPARRVQIYAENIGAQTPDKRRSVIVSMRRMEPAAEIDALRRDLFLHRHTGPKGQEMDRVMAAIMSFIHLGRDQSRMTIPEIRQILKGLGFELVDGSDAAAQELLVCELRNGARRYLSCCSGVDYAKAFWGLMAASKRRQNDKTTEDIWLATRGIERLVARSLTEEEQRNLQVYMDAVLAEFYLFDEDARDWYADYDKRH